jgi:hypothetical protein
MAEFRRAKTQFVRDRISETKYSDIDFIKILLDIEDNIPLDHDYPSWCWSNVMRVLGRCRLERDLIKAEMLEGKITTTQEYRELKRKEALERQKKEAKYELELAEEKKKDLEWWTTLGGLPD